MRLIHWAGDSTNTANKAHKYPQTGIAQAFDRYTAADVVIYDHAINGRSTKSFIDQGRLETIAREIGEGQFLFIQFGHNDEKKEDPLRYTAPDGDFIDNLGRFAAVARDAGAYPLFITPVERRLFTEDGRTLRSPSAHEPYVAGYREAARRFEVPLIDLWTDSRAFLERLGDAESVRLFMHLRPGEAMVCPGGQRDDTHLKYEGAMQFGRLVAESLVKLPEVYASLVDTEVLEELAAQDAVRAAGGF
ncbi:MAG: rhamnogalacturonan acetylesterase, partial [Lachnospiraceae bacterium]|nr:rhamnogalacturonan acetylesterase [Lachnospiraceae bacterium]